MLSRRHGRNYLEPTITAVAIYREISVIKRKDGVDAFAFSQVYEGSIGQVRLKFVITAQEPLQPGHRALVHGQEREQTTCKELDQAFDGFHIPKQQPLRFRNDRPASKQRRTQVRELFDTALVVLVGL